MGMERPMSNSLSPSNDQRWVVFLGKQGQRVFHWYMKPTSAWLPHWGHVHLCLGL